MDEKILSRQNILKCKKNTEVIYFMCDVLFLYRSTSVWLHKRWMGNHITFVIDQETPLTQHQLTHE